MSQTFIIRAQHGIVYPINPSPRGKSLRTNQTDRPTERADSVSTSRQLTDRDGTLDPTFVWKCSVKLFERVAGNEWRKRARSMGKSQITRPSRGERRPEGGHVVLVEIGDDESWLWAFEKMAEYEGYRMFHQAHVCSVDAWWNIQIPFFG